MKRRKPQARCKCGHARSQHGKVSFATFGVDYFQQCGFCFSNCLKFEQDNLATLERLNEFKEHKENKEKEVIK